MGQNLDRRMRPERCDVFHRDAVMVAEKPDECRVMVDISADDLGQLLLAEVKDRSLPDGNRIVGVRSSVERARQAEPGTRRCDRQEAQLAGSGGAHQPDLTG